MSFKDIKGQDSAIRFLKNALKDKKTAHAYIFVGPSGIGKRIAALNFAKALNCGMPVQDEPCDRCASCKKIDTLNHPDIFIVRPKDDEAIKIERIRELTRHIGLKPYEGRSKICIIDDAHLMTQDASNALLKTLEEPPSDSILILLTNNMGGLLPTIISRAQAVRFFSLAPDIVKDILMKSYNVEEKRASVLSRLSGGRCDEALRYKNEDFFERRSQIIEAITDETYFESDFDGLSRRALKLNLDIMLMWYRDILITKLNAFEPAGLFNIDKIDRVSKEAKRFEVEQLHDIIKEIISTGHLLDRKANPKLAMSVLGTVCTKSFR